MNGVPRLGREQQPARLAAGTGYGLDGRAAARVHLEVQVRVDPVRVARVADVADRLRRRATCAPLFSPFANATPGTQPPSLSFSSVRSLFRWM